ncbi:MAG: response regulator [Deltaproteobacteria bacterium]|nr:response regulator [Deltaproteobacteria bacterium]
MAIIDDDPSARQVLRGFLNERGYTVASEGADGSEALGICSTYNPDVVIMDIKMPGKDGIEAATEINRHSSVPVVLITGREDEDTVRRAAEAGVMAYLVKPVREEELFAAIELAISRHGEYLKLRKENVDLKNTIETRKFVEKAKGLLMEKDRITEAEAYSRIRKISMDRRMTMKEVSEIIVSSLKEGGQS